VRLGWVVDICGVKSKSFYVKDKVAYTFEDGEPYVFFHSVSPSLFMGGWNYPFLWKGGCYLNLNEFKQNDWDLPDYKLYKPFVDLFMDTYRVWCSNPTDGGLGVKTHEFHNTFSSNLICMIWGKIKDSLKKNMTEAQRLNDFKGFIAFLDTQLRSHMINKKRQPGMHKNLPKAVEEIRTWFDNEWDTYRKSVPEPAKDITIHFADPVDFTDKSISA